MTSCLVFSLTKSIPNLQISHYQNNAINLEIAFGDTKKCDLIYLKTPQFNSLLSSTGLPPLTSGECYVLLNT